MAARVLVIQHEDECPPAWLADWLVAGGVTLDVVCGHRAEPVPRSCRGYDGLLVLGGDMGAYDDEPCPWLRPTKELIAVTVAAGTPFLGVCLGHQLAAVALGGAVGRNPRGAANGLTPVALTPEGRDDVLLGENGQSSTGSGRRAVQWNRDVVTRVPPAATVLAAAPDGSPQALRFARLAWGVQFHPEASPEVFAGWTVNSPTADQPRPDGVDVRAVAAAVQAAGPTLRQTWQPFGLRFAAIVCSAMTRPGAALSAS